MHVPSLKILCYNVLTRKDVLFLHTYRNQFPHLVTEYHQKIFDELLEKTELTANKLEYLIFPWLHFLQK